MDNGDAWRAATTLTKDAPLTIAIGADDVLAYQGDRRVEVIGARKLQKFSLRRSFSGLEFADGGKE